jgi:hypothetical protein
MPRQAPQQPRPLLPGLPQTPPQAHPRSPPQQCQRRVRQLCQQRARQLRRQRGPPRDRLRVRHDRRQAQWPLCPHLVRVQFQLCSAKLELQLPQHSDHRLSRHLATAAGRVFVCCYAVRRLTTHDRSAQHAASPSSPPSMVLTQSALLLQGRRRRRVPSPPPRTHRRRSPLSSWSSHPRRRPPMPKLWG